MNFRPAVLELFHVYGRTDVAKPIGAPQSLRTRQKGYQKYHYTLRDSL
jgi:hypothetical protein